MWDRMAAASEAIMMLACAVMVVAAAVGFALLVAMGWWGFLHA